MQVPRKASTTERSKNCGLVSKNHTFNFTTALPYEPSPRAFASISHAHRQRI
jgi:hypothetical protein